MQSKKRRHDAISRRPGLNGKEWEELPGRDAERGRSDVNVNDVER